MSPRPTSGPVKCLFLYLRTVFIWCAGILIFLFGAYLALLAYIVDRLLRKPGDCVHIISRYFGRALLLISGIKVYVEGLENVRKDHAQLLCSNHQSLFDIFLLDSFIPIQFRFVVKKELFSVPVLGWCLKMERQIFLDRQNRRKGVQSIKDAVSMISRGRSVLVFPEGTRSLDGQIKEFKKGSLLIATIAKVPVVPVTIDGTVRILPRGSFLLSKQSVRLVIAPPIETQGLSRSEQRGLAEKVRDVIVKNMYHE